MWILTVIEVLSAVTVGEGNQLSWKCFTLYIHWNDTFIILFSDIFGGLDPVKYDNSTSQDSNFGFDIDLKKRDYTDDDLISFQKNFRSECVNQSPISEVNFSIFLILQNEILHKYQPQWKYEYIMI